MRRFVLIRNKDISGVSGTGIVVEGVCFSNGHCALRWLTDKSSIAIYDSIEDVVDIHGHSGSTVLVWIDKEET